MTLELITRQPEGPAKPTPLLFVHGAWHGAWCWDEYFLPYFAQHGYSSHALSLRGHGNSPGIERIRWTRVRDYVQDVAQIVAQLPAPPVLIGHSMGGFIVQKYLERYGAAAAVLLAAAPPTGVIKTVFRVMRHHPIPFLKVNLKLSLYPLIATPELAQANLFSATMPAAQVAAYQQRLQEESYLGFLDYTLLDLVKQKKVRRVPMLVLGASDDTIFSPRDVIGTAKAYRTEAKLFDNMAHDMMLEPGWQEVADHILAWLDNQP